MQIRRPWRISRRLRAPRSLGWTVASRSSSIFTGSFAAVSPRRRLSRATWVSTGIPGRSKATLRTTLAVLHRFCVRLPLVTPTARPSELQMTVGDLTPLCRDSSNGSGCWRADCRSACCGTARGGGDPISVAARCGAAVAPRGADHGLRGPRDEPGPRPLGPFPCGVRSMAHGSLGRRLRS